MDEKSESRKVDPRFSGTEVVVEPSFAITHPTPEAVLISLTHPRYGLLNFLIQNQRAQGFADLLQKAMAAPSSIAPGEAGMQTLQ